MQLANFNTATFLRDHWQKKPLLIKNPWGAWSNPLSPDELAGLACEEAVESRLITQAHDTAGDTWTVENGPIPESRFGALGDKHWTLLVQAVDHYMQGVAALIEPFRFIPDWRIDDVMVSYAADGGGVGPHFDLYDVFLIQGLGKRRWQVGAVCDDTSKLLPHEDLRLLAEFEATDEWVLEPGDILYVPPGIAHNGVAVGDDCMTYSIGFRAPSRAELIGHYCDDLLEELKEDDRYSDPGLDAQKNPGEISSSAVDRLHAMVTEKVADRNAFARWFGEYNSTPKYPDMNWQPDAPMKVDDLRKFLSRSGILRRNPASRFSYIQQRKNELLLFVDGQTFEIADEIAVFARKLCAQNRVEIDPGLQNSDSAMRLVAELYNMGCLEKE